jgi:exosortase/archaeosortase family protein
MKQNPYKIFIRYAILLALGLGNLILLYKTFSPLTIFPTYYLLNLFLGNVQLIENSLIIGSYTIEIIRACVAPTAYYLLLALNLATPMTPKKRIHSILFSFTLLLIINILRISALSIMFINQNSSFDFTHKLLWYGLSTIFVAGIWFITIYKYKIKEIPLYSDFLTFRKIIRK